jgi:hypothetical protein
MNGQKRADTRLPNMRKFIPRLSSFHEKGYQSAFLFACSGFYYNPSQFGAASVKCAYCDLQLNEWELSVKHPMDIHIKLKPKCIFVTHFVCNMFTSFSPMGFEFLQEIKYDEDKHGKITEGRKGFEEIERTGTKITSNAKDLKFHEIIKSIKEFEDEIDESNKINSCKICLVRLSNRMIIPCNHIHLCNICVDNISSCPMCMGVIKGVAEVFF